MTDLQSLAFRWLSDYHFYRQIAKREQDPRQKEYFQRKAREAKQEYDALMEKIGGR